MKFYRYIVTHSSVRIDVFEKKIDAPKYGFQIFRLHRARALREISTEVVTSLIPLHAVWGPS